MALLALVAVPALASARTFPGTDPDESVRLNTPNDPGFDHCESDDEDGADVLQRLRRGVRALRLRAQRRPSTPRSTTTRSTRTPALRRRTRSPGATRSGRSPASPPTAPGSRSTGSAGRPDRDPRHRHPLEQPRPAPQGRAQPRRAAAAQARERRDCAAYDCNGDGAFNVDDYANDPRVSQSAGNDEADEILDGSDLIAAFSNGSDADAQRLRRRHRRLGLLRRRQRPLRRLELLAARPTTAPAAPRRPAQQTATTATAASASARAARSCRCGSGTRSSPTRTTSPWPPCTPPTTTSRSSRARSGGLFNSRFARARVRLRLPARASSSRSSPPTSTPPTTTSRPLYDEAMQVQGTVADVQGLGQNPPQQVVDFLSDLGDPAVGNAPIGTWFRNSGTTQYGGHAHIVMPAVTGSPPPARRRARRGCSPPTAASCGVALAAERDQAAAHA